MLYFFFSCFALAWAESEYFVIAAINALIIIAIPIMAYAHTIKRPVEFEGTVSPNPTVVKVIEAKYPERNKPQFSVK